MCVIRTAGALDTDISSQGLKQFAEVGQTRVSVNVDWILCDTEIESKSGIHLTGCMSKEGGIMNMCSDAWQIWNTTTALRIAICYVHAVLAKRSAGSEVLKDGYFAAKWKMEGEIDATNQNQLDCYQIQFIR